MQVLVLIMMMALLAHDTPGMDVNPALGGWAMVAAVIGPYVLIVLGMWAACRRVLHVMATRPSRTGRVLRRLDALMALSRVSILALFLADLYLLGWLSWLRSVLGSWVLVNDALAAAPALAAVVMGWWAYYPIDRRIREVVLIRQLDGGEAVWPVESRGRYVWSQTRHQLLLTLVPLAALLAWTQIVGRWIAPDTSALADYAPALVMAGGLSVFLFAPLMIRSVWDTAALPDGPLRDRLLGLCRSYGVRVRQLLLWRTYGGLINGAVMGLIGPLRFILLTDGLIERMDDDHIEAVMAHELGHVKRRHMVWLAVCAIGTLGGAAWLVDAAMAGLYPLLPTGLPGGTRAAAAVLDGAGLALLIAVWAVLFGYISRRFERQADTFAAQHMARRYPHPDQSPERISGEAAYLVADALRRVAELNHIPMDRRSWRHGTMRWRVEHLRGLVGTPIDRCPIDQEVRRICWACAGLLVVVAAADLFLAYSN